MAKWLQVGICAYRAGGPARDRQRAVRENLRGALDLVRHAAAQGAELVVLPEVFAIQNVNEWPEAAEPLDGPVIDALKRESRRLGIGIAAGHALLVDGRRRNSVVLLDRRGRVAALYHKAYPTIYELERGICPGEGPVAADTEFGRIGFAICYDLNFAELRLGYRDLKPELILFCSMFRGGLQTRWWAFETRAHLVSSVEDHGSMVVNPVGRVLAETSVWSRVVLCPINLDFGVFHLDYTNRNLQPVLARHGRSFQVEWAEPEGVMLVTACGRLSVRRLAQEAGWEEAEGYFARAREARERFLKGEKLRKGAKPW